MKRMLMSSAAFVFAVSMALTSAPKMGKRSWFLSCREGRPLCRPFVVERATATHPGVGMADQGESLVGIDDWFQTDLGVDSLCVRGFE